MTYDARFRRSREMTVNLRIEATSDREPSTSVESSVAA